MTQVLGLCRFSYPSEPGAFSYTAPTIEALREVLYEPSRLTQRLFFFEQLVLPGLKAQTDPDFTVLLIAGDQLPRDVRAGLDALVAEVPQVKTLYLPEGQTHRKVCIQAMLDHRDTAESVVLEFRIDDDDAIAPDFVAQTRDRFGRAFGIFRDDGRMCLDFSHGHLMAFRDDGIAVQEVRERMWTPAQVICRRVGMRQSLLSANHLSLWQSMPVVTLPEPAMFIRGAHAGNDSDLLNRPRLNKGWKAFAQRQDHGLAARFAIDPTALTEGWSRLRRSQLT